MVRVTFSLDDATVERLRRVAASLGKPQSLVVREAIADYASRADRLSEPERRRLLAVLDRVRRARPSRASTEVDAELEAVRDARRQDGRRRTRA